MNLNELKSLVEQQDTAQRAASEAVKGTHQKALEAAVELRDSLEAQVGEGQRRDRLKAVVEAAAAEQFKTKPDLQMAGLVLGQHASAVGDMNGIPAAASRDGRYLVQHAVSSTSSYSPEQRQKVLAAIVIAAMGKTETGLIEFPKDWHKVPSLAALEQMAGLLDADALAKLDAEAQAVAAQLGETQRLLDALTQAEPKLYTLVDGDEGLSVEVINRRGGSIGIGGVTFENGINKLTSAEFSKVRSNDTFKAYEEKGLLEIKQTSQLVQEL